MTKDQVKECLSYAGEATNEEINFKDSTLSYINFSKYQNIFIDPCQTRFYFDDSDELVFIYKCKDNLDDKTPIEYLVDTDGNRKFDVFSYESIQHFVFGGGSPHD